MIYICIPSHDEQQTVGVLLWKIRQVMAEFRRDYQVLVLDDASTDRTQEVLEPYLRIMPLTVIRHSERQGYARSLERLVREAVRRAPYAKRDCVVTIQADFTDDPEQIPTLVKRIEGGADLATTRTVLPEDATRGLRWTRRALVQLARRLRRWPREVSDPLSGFRAYRVISLRKVFEEQGQQPLLRGDGWAVNAELLQAVVHHTRRIEELDMPLRLAARQRASRIQPSDAFKQVWAFVRNLHDDDSVPPPDAVDVHEVTAESVAELAASGRLRREPANGQRRRKGPTDRTGEPGRKNRRGGQKRKKKATSGAEAASPAPAGGAADGSEEKKKKPRRRRGGRGRRGGRRGGSADTSAKTPSSS